MKQLCPKCLKPLKVEHYLYKNILYRSRLICTTVEAEIDWGRMDYGKNKKNYACGYIYEPQLPVQFWSEDLNLLLTQQNNI